MSTVYTAHSIIVSQTKRLKAFAAYIVDKQLIILFLVLLFTPLQNGECAFVYTDYSARGLGMNGAICTVTGVTADTAGVYYNPALTAISGGNENTSRPRVSMSYESLYPGVMDSLWLGTLVYTHPVNRIVGTFGVNYLQFGSSLYSEQVAGLTYAREMLYFEPLKLGVTVKTLTKSYGQTGYTNRDPTFANAMTATGVSYDVGLTYATPLSGLVAGASARNVDRPNIKLVKRDIVPAEYRVGLGYQMETVSTELVYYCTTSAGTDAALLLGSEWWILRNVFAFRAGCGYGVSEYKSVSFGLSYRFSIPGMKTFITLDYGYGYQFNGAMDNTVGNNLATLNIQF